jgi:hypothetical protein
LFLEAIARAVRATIKKIKKQQQKVFIEKLFFYFSSNIFFIFMYGNCGTNILKIQFSCSNEILGGYFIANRNIY